MRETMRGYPSRVSPFHRRRSCFFFFFCGFFWAFLFVCGSRVLLLVWLLVFLLLSTMSRSY